MLLGKLAILLIKMYRLLLSPILPKACRFYPSCSEYGLHVFRSEKVGFFSAAKLVTLRILRCHPWSEGGIDLPPHYKDNEDGK